MASHNLLRLSRAALQARAAATLVRYGFDFDATLRVLSDMQSLIAKSHDWLSRVAKDASGDDDWFVSELMEEQDATNSLLGCAFVFCQTCITSICTRMMTAADLLAIPGAGAREQ